MTAPRARADAGGALLDAVAVMDRLRSPGGCPWDAEQTHASLVRYLLEECYEALDALMGRPHGADARGWFLNPHAGRVERPRGALATALLRPLARRALARLTGG